MKTILLIIIIACLTSCTQKNKTQSSGTSELIDISKLQGIWTNGTSEKATFQIEKDSIYYVDANQTFSYKIKGDSIEIAFDGFTEAYRISKLNNDSLILKNMELTDIFTRFKE